MLYEEKCVHSQVRTRAWRFLRHSTRIHSQTPSILNVSQYSNTHRILKRVSPACDLARRTDKLIQPVVSRALAAAPQGLDLPQDNARPSHLFLPGRGHPNCVRTSACECGSHVTKIYLHAQLGLSLDKFALGANVDACYGYRKRIDRGCLPDNADGLSFAAGSGEDAARLDDLCAAKELLSTFGFRKNLLRWFGGVRQPAASISRS